MKKVTFGIVLGMLGIFVVPSAQAKWWNDIFQNSEVSMIQYGKPRSSEVKKRGQPTISITSFQNRPVAEKPAFGPDKSSHLTPGIVRSREERNLPRYRLENQPPVRNASSLLNGGSSFKKALRAQQGRDRMTIEKMEHTYWKNKMKSFDRIE